MKEKKELKLQKVKEFFSKHNVKDFIDWTSLKRDEKSSLLKKFYTQYKSLWASKNSMGVEIREYFKTGQISGDNSDIGDFDSILAEEKEIKQPKKRLNRKTMHEFEEKMKKENKTQESQIDISNSLVENTKTLEMMSSLIDNKDLSTLLSRMLSVIKTQNRIIKKIMMENGKQN